MSKDNKKRSRKAKLVPRMYVDLDVLRQNEELQPTPTIPTFHEPEDSNDTPESMSTPIPFTVKVEVESGDDDDDWWKELEEQAKKEKEAQNETKSDENVTVKSEPFEGDGDLSHKEDNNTDELVEDWSCKNYNESKAKLSEKAINKFDIPQCYKNDIRTSLDDKSNEEDFHLEKIPGDSKTPQLKLGDKELASKVKSKPASKRKKLKRASNNVLSVCKKAKPSESETAKSILELDSPEQYYTKSVYETLKKLHESKSVKAEIVIQSYKCYECKYCWEHYYDFKTHLNMFHSEIMLSIGIEMVKNPHVNVIAAIWTKESNIVFQDNFKILSEDGVQIYKCLKCKKMLSSDTDLESHKKSLIACICKETKPCFELVEHQGNCNDYLESQLSKECDCGSSEHETTCLRNAQCCSVCSQTFPSSKTLLDHQTVFHTVRSDEFKLQFPSSCVHCLAIYVGIKMSHYCPKLPDARYCRHCNRQFQNNLFLDVHLKAYAKPERCETCGKVLAKACQRYQHDAFLHDSGLQVVHKCNICGQLFTNQFYLSGHVMQSHKIDKIKYVYAGSWVLLPKNRIRLNGTHCEIVEITSSDDHEIRTNCSDLPRNRIDAYYDKEISKHLDILGTAIRYRILRDTKIRYECKLCKTSWVDITDFKTHLLTDHQQFLMTVTADYTTSPKIIAQTTTVTEPNTTEENAMKLAKKCEESIFVAVRKSVNTSFPVRRITCYKCYQCMMCWEHYTWFREHLKVHTRESDKELCITSEIQDSFVCIAALREANDAYSEDLNIIDESGTEEIFKCLKCKEMYRTRADLDKHKGTNFRCAGCPLFKGSCFELKIHEGRCQGYFDSLNYLMCDCGATCDGSRQIDEHRKLCNRGAVVFRCEVCSAQYPIIDFLTKHQVAWHAVRSDEFAPYTNVLHKCKLCSAPTISSKWKYHQCPKRRDKVHCKWCKKQFQSKYFLAVHAKAYKNDGNIRCEKCDMALGSECLRDEHEVRFHESGNSAILVFKCNLCKEMFMNEHDVVKHVPTAHSDNERACYVYHYRKLIVPRKEIAVLGNRCVVYINDQNIAKYLNEASTSNDNIDYEISITQSIVYKPDILVTTEDKNETQVIVKEEKMDDQDTIERAPDVLDDTSEPDEFRLVIKEEVFDETMEEAFEASENSMDLKIDEEVVVKQEVKSELKEEFQEIIAMQYQNEKQEAEETIDQFIKNHSEITMMEIEPEILLNSQETASKEAQKRGKIYTCKKCNFSGIHSVYRAHKEECTRFKIKKIPIPCKRLESMGKIVCSKCQKEYDDLFIYLHHLKHHSVPDNVCPECKEDLASQAKLNSHVIRHIRTNFVRMYVISGMTDDFKTLKIFHCNKCKQIIEQQCFFQHWESHLNLDEIKVKEEAQKDTESASTSELQDDSNSNGDQNLDPESRQYLIDTLVDNTRRNRGEAKTCQLCNRSFSRNHDAKRHLIEHLYDEARANKVANDGLKCPICLETRETRDVFKKHMRDHASLPMYQCHLCNKTFSDSSNFAKHKKVHGLRVLICDYCGRKFQCKKQLEVHIIKHVRMPPKRCEECNLEFFYESLFNKHVKKYHGEGGVVGNSFCCGVCRRRFPTLKHKWDHEWEVHKERKTKADCPVCGEKFRKFNDVKQHIRTQHNIALYKSSCRFVKLIDTINKYNVPTEVVEELLRQKTNSEEAVSRLGMGE